MSQEVTHNGLGDALEELASDLAGDAGWTREQVATALQDLVDLACTEERAAIRAEVEAEMADDGGRLSALAIIDAREPKP